MDEMTAAASPRPAQARETESVTPSRRTALVARCLIAGLGVLAGGLLAMLSVATQIEDLTRNAFFALRSNPTSGQLVVVEMDAASLESIERWPWPRSHYAAVIDRLNRAGARSIVFDVDFSAPSTPVDDARLAAAIANASGKVVLPTFAQRAGSTNARTLDALPIAQLREQAMLASVAVRPDSDGLIRRMPLGTITADLPRPSLSAHIAQRAGNADRQYPLDLAIDPAAIPRLSFVAVEQGRFASQAVAGKDVLIGATAIEMGDRYVIPRWGVLPGVIIQALGAETLYDGLPTAGGPALPLGLSIVAVLAISGSRSKRAVMMRGSVALLALLACYWAAWQLGPILFDIVPAMLAILATTALNYGNLFRQELQARRMRDPLTGLPNRLALDHAGSGAGCFAVASTIAGFERLHAVLGEAQAAELVGRLAERLAAGNGGRAVYRLDDRTLAWISDCSGLELEQQLAALCLVMRHPVEIGGRRIDTQMAFGIALAGEVREAALAASEALRRGERWHYHVAAEQAELERQVSLMGELDSAIAQGELEVVYQPKLHLASGAITSVEALVRWHHPTRGHLRPDLFIPLAEESDRITDLTLFVLERAIRDLQSWCERGLIVSAAVNISARLVASEVFLAAAEALLIRLQVPRDRLIFEVTESATISDPDRAVAALRRFRALGVAVSLDDYGTGQSTLTYLKQLPLSELKIDRSFVQFAHRDKSDASLVRSTINLAHELGLSVVAEGVEDEECLAFLRTVECDYVQGYLIGRPMPARDIVTSVEAFFAKAA